LVELEPLRLLLTRVRWTNGQALYEPGERIEHVYFVEEGLASVVAEADDANSRVEVGMAGPESMAGLSALLDPETTPFNRVFVQMAGVAYRMTAPALLESVVTMPTLRRLLFRALDASMAQVAQTAVCNSRHSLPERLARWLLFAHDRVDGDELPLTQAFLSVMLGVRRSGVTIALGTLQMAGFVQRRRGRVVVCDRAGLEAAACDCYGRVQAFVAILAARSS